MLSATIYKTVMFITVDADIVILLILVIVLGVDWPEDTRHWDARANSKCKLSSSSVLLHNMGLKLNWYHH